MPTWWEGRTPRWWRRHGSELTFAALLLLGAAIVLYETRGFSFYFDDWEFVLHRRGLGPHTLLSPHGPHLVLVPILVYKLALNVFGGTYLPFRVLAALDVVLVALVLGLVCRRLWGRWWGLLPVALLVTLGSGAWTLLWSFQVGYALATATGVLALVALTSERRHANLAACLLLALSLASGSQGVGFVAGAAVMLVLRGDWRRNAWVVLIPGVLYALWYLKYGHQASETQLSQWRNTLPYVMKAAASTMSGLLGLSSPTNELPPQLDPSFGEPIVLAALAGLVIALVRGWRPPRLLWGILATLVVLWIAAALSNTLGIRRPTDSRYLPTSAVLLLIGVCVALPRPRLRGAGALAALLALFVIALTNAGQFTAMRNQMLQTSLQSRAQLGALLIMRGIVPPYFTPAPPFGPGLVNDVQADPFYSAYDAFGGLPSDSPAQITQQTEGTRELADQALGRGEEVGYVFGPARPAAGVAPTVLAGRALTKDGCIVLDGSPVQIRAVPGTYAFLPRRGERLTSAAARFASQYGVTLGVVAPGRTATLHLPADRAPQIPWRLAISGVGRVCA